MICRTVLGVLGAAISATMVSPVALAETTGSVLTTSATVERTTKTAEVKVPIRHLFKGQPLKFHETGPAMPGGWRVAVTRLEYIISNIRLQRDNGSWVPLPGQYFHLDPVDGKSELALRDPPEGRFKAIGFRVGLDRATNHGDPARWPAGHALNVVENNLHWTWADGYIFMAIEGYSQDPKGKQAAFVYHVGNDSNAAEILIPAGKGTTLAESEIVFNVDKLFNAAEGVSPIAGETLTHSGKDDTLAPRLAHNAERSFAFRRRGS